MSPYPDRKFKLSFQKKPLSNCIDGVHVSDLTILSNRKMKCIDANVCRRVETIAQSKYSANPTLRNQANGNWLPRPVSEDVDSPKERLGINISRDEKQVSACAGSDAGLRLGCLIPLLSRAAPASDRNRRPILRMPTRADDAPELSC